VVVSSPFSECSHTEAPTINVRAQKFGDVFETKVVAEQEDTRDLTP
jgi:hypothetical protein